MKIKGIIPPILTPFNEKDEVDIQRLEKFVEFLKPHVEGFYVCGSYGSGILMNVSERKKVFEAISNFAGDKFQLIVHVGTTNLKETVELAHHAESHGALAVAAVPPFYFQHDDDTLYEYFHSLMETVTIPVYIYDNPKATGNQISLDLLNRLAAEGLQGVKDSTFDIGKTYKVLRNVSQEDFDVVMGSESLLLPAFSMGVQACISGLANALPELMHKLYQAAMKKDLDASRDLQEKVLKMWDVLHIGPSNPTAYAMLHIRGVDVGFPRKPLLPLSKGLYQQVEAAMKATEQIWKT